MTFDRHKTHLGLESLLPTAQALFSLLCSERLRNCCWAFSMKEGKDCSAYFEGCDLVFQRIRDSKTLSEGESAQLSKQIDLIVPRSDDYGYPLAVQAQSGMVALLCCLDAWQSGDPLEGVEAASVVVDAHDNYEYNVHKHLRRESIDPREYLLLDREITWQGETLELLSKQRLRSSEEVTSLRVLNRSYVVPIAVP